MSDYFSWRFQAIKLLEDVLNQEADCCWAIAVIRQLSAMLKMEKVLSRSDSLSIQYVIDGLPRKQINAKGGLIKFDDIGEFLMKEGTVRENLCPLTYRVDENPQLLPDAHKFKISSFKVYTPADYMDHATFEDEILGHLKFGPIAVSIPAFDSFKNLNGFDKVYFPSDSEISAYVSGSKIKGFHSMLLTGNGVENGVKFFEFQDTNGTMWGENGYIKIACGLGIYVNFIKMELVPKSPEYFSDMDMDYSDMEIM